jgi:hypothetical protein
MQELLQGVQSCPQKGYVKEPCCKVCSGSTFNKVSKKHFEKLEVSRRNKLRRDNRWKFFSREEPTKIFTINKQDPFRGIKIFLDREIWESCSEDSLKILRHFMYSEV